MSDQRNEVLEMEDVDPNARSVKFVDQVTPVNKELSQLTPTKSKKKVVIVDGNEKVSKFPPGFQESESLYFDDGKRQIDYVLAFSTTGDKEDVAVKKVAKRLEFETNLQKCGLQLEYEDASKFDGQTHFVKIHAPWDVLTTQAEVLKLKMPIKRNEGQSSRVRVGGGVFGDCLDKILTYGWNPMALDKELVAQPDYYTAVFSRQLEDQFLINDKDTFFSNAERSRMVWDFLIRTNYDRNQSQRFGISRLIKNGTYLAAYPLHDGFSLQLNLHRKEGDIETKPSPRQILYQTWAKPSMFYKYQPLDLVRNYFGEKIAIYFAWLGFYTKALVPAALVGIFCLVFGAATLDNDPPSMDICNETGVGNVTMCPNCDSGCSTWKLGQSCVYAKVTHLFDNWFTVLFAACMSVWATLFLEGWKRSQSRLTWDWDLTDYELEEEWEPFLPFNQRVLRIIGSCVTVAFFLLLVLAFVFGVIVYRVIVEYVLDKHHDNFVRSNAQILTAVTAAFLNLLCIMCLDWVYQSLAWKLTNWEFPRTQAQFEDSYTFKVFLFQFINYNSSLFYIAFFKGKFTTVPNWTQNYIFGYPPEKVRPGLNSNVIKGIINVIEGLLKCDPAGCMVELVIQLAIIMIGKQFVGNCMEILFPICWNKWRTCCGKKSLAAGNYARWEKDYDLNAVPPMHLFDEYLEMVLQYGFVTLFVPAFPLAPLFALINNIMEIRLDAFKFIVAYRRPMPARAYGLGVWYDILDGISKMAVLTNACVIAFTSDFVPRLVYQIVYSVDNTLNGYVESELAYYDTKKWCLDSGNRSDICSIPYCRFADYRNSPCSLNITNSVCACDPNSGYSVCIKWWHVLAAKLAFVLVFEHLVFLIKGVVAYLIPDTPHEVQVQIQKEIFLAKQAFYKHELASHVHSQEKIKAMAGTAVMNEIENKNATNLPPVGSPREAYYTPSGSLSSLVVEDVGKKK